MSAKIVLDSFALVSFFHKEPGWEKVREVLYGLSSASQKALLSPSIHKFGNEFIPSGLSAE